MQTTLEKQFGSVPVTCSELKLALRDYRAPLSRIALHQRRGEIIPLRRNLYLCSPESYSLRSFYSKISEYMEVPLSGFVL